MNAASIKNKKTLIIAAVVLIAAALVAALFIFRRPAPVYAYVAVKTGDLQAATAVSGTVKAAQAVDLAFERSGKITQINVKVGDHVNAGQILARLSAADTAAQYEQAQAAYQAQLAVLAQLREGARQEDLNITQTAVNTAQNALSDARNNQTNVQNKAGIDITNVYGKTNDILNGAYAQSFDALSNKIGDLFADARTNPQLLISTSDQALQTQVVTQMASAQADLSTWKIALDGLTSISDPSALTPAVSVSLDTSLTEATVKLNRFVDFLKSVSNLLNYALVGSNYPAASLVADKINVSLAVGEVNASLSAVNAQIQAIGAQKALNASLLSQAQSQVDQANGSLLTAQSALKLKQAGTDQNQIKAQAAAVASAQANTDNAAAQLAKTALVAPLTGIVSRQDGQIGEIIGANQPFISLQSDAKFQIETQVSEKDLGPLKVGQSATVALDAYGPSRPFPATVIAINPASTTLNGVAVYKVTLEFSLNDRAIKTGMTANINILTGSATNVLMAPASSLIRSGEDNYVIVDDGTPSGRRQAVTVGLNGASGWTEIKSGLNIGDKVALFGTALPATGN